jgi:hypothetical protein
VSIRPTIERILGNVTSADGYIERPLRIEEVAGELQGEAFLNEVASFVNNDVDELLFVQQLVHARSRWSSWAKRISWSLLALLVVECIFLLVFVVMKSCAFHVGLLVLLSTFGVSAGLAAYCILCAGGMLYYHDQISSYREKVL